MEIGPIRYAPTEDGVSIAYRVVGDDPHTMIDLGVQPSHTETLLSLPVLRRNLEHADAYGIREVLYDQRGSGLSTRDVPEISLETMVADLDSIISVMQLDRVVLSARFLSSLVAISYAHSHPDRVDALILDGGFAYVGDIPGLNELVLMIEANWPVAARTIADITLPAAARSDPDMTEGLARYMREAADAPAAAATFRTGFFGDVRPLLDGVLAPTLVRHQQHARNVPESAAQELAVHIPNAELNMVGWDNPWPVSDSELDEAWELVSEFLDRVVGPGDAPQPAGSHSPFQTILFTDLESSTALTQRVGDEAAQEVLRGHNSAVRGALEAHDGREVKHTGDGIMASFPSAVSAVEASLAIQRELEGGEVRVRIGINAGEPVAEDDDLFGTAVQLAARITDRAEPGQVLVSRVVMDLCAGKTFEFTSAGDATMKGFDEPVALYAVRGS
ncbi:MAG TPA: adenylate/guanylate cyclase domain-containing protein [Dehalococcoidia bacterium]|nr:adenylate/guanylate cyclase domain-containing protein [Dehalococcoidia bacterium]